MTKEELSQGGDATPIPEEMLLFPLLEPGISESVTRLIVVSDPDLTGEKSGKRLRMQRTQRGNARHNSEESRRDPVISRGRENKRKTKLGLRPAEARIIRTHIASTDLIGEELQTEKPLSNITEIYQSLEIAVPNTGQALFNEELEEESRRGLIAWQDEQEGFHVISIEELKEKEPFLVEPTRIIQSDADIDPRYIIESEEDLAPLTWKRGEELGQSNPRFVDDVPLIIRGIHEEDYTPEAFA